MRSPSAKALTCLVEQARQVNARQHLTEFWFYGNQRFIQLLRGEPATLEAAYARTSQDAWHQHLYVRSPTTLVRRL